MGDMNSSINFTSPEIELLLACAGYCAGYRRYDEIEPLLEKPLDWDAFDQSCRRHGLYPLAHRVLPGELSISRRAKRSETERRRFAFRPS